MKLLIYIVAIAMLVSSCDEKKNTGNVCIINSKLITIKNANTTLSVDNDIKFGITFKKNNEIFPLTNEMIGIKKKQKVNKMHRGLANPTFDCLC